MHPAGQLVLNHAERPREDVHVCGGPFPGQIPIPGSSPRATSVARAHRSATSADADPIAPTARGSTALC